MGFHNSRANLESSVFRCRSCYWQTKVAVLRLSIQGNLLESGFVSGSNVICIEKRKMAEYDWANSGAMFQLSFVRNCRQTHQKHMQVRAPRVFQVLPEKDLKRY